MRWNVTYDYPLIVQFEDVDFQRVVHHPNYLKYFERARIAAMETAGYSFMQLLSDGFGLVVADIRIGYKMPLLFGQQYVVQSRLAAVSSASFRVRQVVHEGRPEDCEAFRNADVDEWDTAANYAALADIVLVHVQLPRASSSGRDSGELSASPTPFGRDLLQVLGIQALAEGRLDAEVKALLRASKVRLR
jgi:YbgC/YbaW family acyl-CoA thioester hydrolase